MPERAIGKGSTLVGGFNILYSCLLTLCSLAVPSWFYTFAGDHDHTQAERSLTLLRYCTVLLYFGRFNNAVSTFISLKGFQCWLEKDYRGANYLGV